MVNDFPKKISRKTCKEWTQETEIEFLKFDLPVECVIRSFDYKLILKGYFEALKYRRKPYMEGHPVEKDELRDVVVFCLNNIPRVWNLGEMKEGTQNNKWVIKYPNKEPIAYTSY